MTTRPAYRDLPDGCAWEYLDAELGSLERLSAERVVDAARLVRRGARFSLDLPLDVPSPPFFGREAMRHEIFELRGSVLDDRLDSFFPQAKGTFFVTTPSPENLGKTSGPVSGPK